MKISVVQINCVLGNIDKNLKKISDYVLKAKQEHCKLVVFPEMVDTGYHMETISKKASSWNNNSPYSLIKSFGKKNNINIICNISERVDNKIYNTTLVVNSKGQEIGKYRKNHLADFPPINEGSCFSPGQNITIVKINNFKFGLLTCYDLRFPEISRAYALKGVHGLVLCSAWPCQRLFHWNTLICARAIENQIYFIAANRVGTDKSISFCGSSMIVDPSGEIISSAFENNESLIFSEVNLETIKKIKALMPVFQHRTIIDKHISL
jgi:predicted amidohydrolase